MKCTDTLQHICEIAGLKRLKQRPAVLNHLLDKQLVMNERGAVNTTRHSGEK